MLFIILVLFLIVQILIFCFWLALYVAVFLKILNMKLTFITIYLEFKSLIQPKLKIVAFLVMMNEWC